MKRRPRVIRMRAVLACLLFAVVVSVGSVPLLAWRAQPRSLQHILQRFTLYEMESGSGSCVHLGHTRAFGVTEWYASPPTSMHPAIPPAIPIESDPRPSWARPPGDAMAGSSNAFSVGFPMRSARGWMGGMTTMEPVIGPLSIARPPCRLLNFAAGSSYFHLPIVPRWPGLIANTLIFFLIPFLPWTLLRWRRLRRIERLGLCYRCRYEFPRAIETCPECGTTRPPN